MNGSTRRRSVLLPSGPYLGLLAVVLFFVALISARGELTSFLGTRNLQVLVNEATIPAIVALGMLLIIVSGGIDLSVGSVVALVTVVTMQTYRQLLTSTGSVPIASLVAIAAGVASGGLCGFTNGIVITRLGIPPFVATLGMFGVARGIAVWLSGRTLVSFPVGGTPNWVGNLSEVHVKLIIFNPGFWSLVLLAILTAVMLRFTVLGRHVYAVGSNEATARLCGIAVNRTKVIIYTLAGLITGWAGVITFAHGSSGDPSAGEGLELTVIAAVVIGGASLSGGRGTVLGTLTGVLILAVLVNGVSLFNVPVEIQYILMGVIIVANTALGRWQRARQS
jgi:ribose transport system permease protein